jgi:hypothetical protein
MKTPLEILSQVQIASPCPVSWESMTGNDHVRHCAQCDKSVYNFSTMTAQEALDLIQAKEGKLCAQLYRRLDGTLLTADCPIGLGEKMHRFWRRVAAIAASVMFLLLPGCRDRQGARSSSTDVMSTTPMSTCRTGGVIIFPPPITVPPIDSSIRQ